MESLETERAIPIVLADAETLGIDGQIDPTMSLSIECKCGRVNSLVVQVRRR